MKAPYGHCPIGGAIGIARERTIGGKDRYSNGHNYPSLTSVLPPEQHVRVRPKGSTSVPILTRTIGDLWPDGSDVPLNRTVRWRADVTDPDDQRAIWRLAACALGTTQETSTSARFAWQWTTGIGHRWCLLVGHFDTAAIWEGAIDIDDISHATAALCLAIWGPQ